MRTLNSNLRLAWLLLVLAATGIQQLVAQTHWHVLPAAHATIAAPADDAGAGSHNDCLLCRVAAHAAAATPPAAPGLFASIPPFVICITARDAADVPAVPAHAWQSRGPPAA